MVQKNVAKFNELLITVRECLHSNQFNLIAIDGYDHEGKSFLAKKISSNLEINCINLDSLNYLNNEKGGSIKWIKYDYLKENLKELQRDKKCVIVEGICVLQILKNINFTPTIHIYVKKLIAGKWPKENYLDYSKNIIDVISKEEEKIDDYNNWLNSDEEAEENNFIAEIDINEMSTEIDENTYRTKNQKNIDFVFSGISRELLEYHYKYKPNEAAQIIYEWEKT